MLNNEGRLIGRVVSTPKLRTINQGAVTTLRLAVNNSVDDAFFTDITFWDKKAEIICEFLEKGREIAVGYYLKNKINKTKSGEEYQTFELVGNDFQFIGKKEEK